MPTPTIAIIGGGPAGAVAALVLARAGLRPVVVDASVGPQAKIGESLPPTLRPLLERLKLAERLDASCAPGGAHLRSFGNRSCWGADEPSSDDFLFGVHGSGWHLDRPSFEATLSEAAIEAGAWWRWDHHAVDARYSRGRWRLEIEGPEALVHVDAEFVIDATGRPARFAHGAGARRVHLDRLVGVAARLHPPQKSPTLTLDGFTLVEALERGWWYSAPLADGRVVAVYMTDGDLIDTRRARTDAGWRELLASAPHTRARLQPWLEAATSPEPVLPQILPAGSAYTLPPSGEGWLAIGDAAAAFDPLSSHGIGSAMTSGYYGACAAAAHLDEDPDALDAYSGLIASIFDDYLGLLHAHYSQEQRWPSSEFWSRRHRRLDLDATP